MSFAKNTPVHFLPGIGWRTASVMHELGIHTAGQLHKIPEKLMLELFGPSIKPVLDNISVPEAEVQYDHTPMTALPQQDIPVEAAAHTDGVQKRTLRKRMQLAAQFVSML